MGQIGKSQPVPIEGIFFRNTCKKSVILIGKRCGKAVWDSIRQKSQNRFLRACRSKAGQNFLQGVTRGTENIMAE